MTPAARRLLGAAQDLVRARAVLDRAEATYQAMFRTGRMGATEEPLQAWKDADSKARDCWHEFVRCTTEATQEAAGASVPDPPLARLPFAVEMAQYSRQAEMKRRFEEECG
jgi:hypothetical protein